MSYFGWMVDIPTGAQLFYIYCVDCISFYLIVFMLWCEYPLVSLSVVYHTLFPVWMVRIPREPVLKALRTTIPEVRVEMIIRCFFCERFHDFVTGWRFLKIPHRSCLQKSKATLHEKYDDRPETHSNTHYIDLKEHHPQVVRRTGGQQQQSSPICLTWSLVNNKTVKKLNLVLRASTACCSFVSCSSLLSSSTFLQGQSIKFPWVLFHWSPSSSVI